MSLPEPPHTNVSDREREKFALDPDLDTVVKTLTKIYGSIEGSFAASGLNIGGKNTVQDFTDSATQLPATPLPQRNAMSVTNYGDDILYVGFGPDVTADLVLGTTSGFQCGPNQSFNLDITDNVILYAIAPVGKTIRCLITELA